MVRIQRNTFQVLQQLLLFKSMPDILDKLQIQNCERHGASFIRRNPATVWRSLAGSHAAGLRVPLDKPEGEACIILHVGASAASARLLPEELMGNKAVSQLI
jgi:hypothetical protein